MERLLVLKLDAQACEAEARLNGIPVARVNPARPCAIVPVHEYTLAGTNRLELVLWPRPPQAPDQPVEPPLPLVVNGLMRAHARVMLPRVGNVIDEASARTLAQLDWAPAAGLAYEAPLTLSEDVTLPVSFPRWRWMDAPLTAITPALLQQALAFVQRLATDLAAGETDSFIAATRLRTEELAVAYQRQPADEAARLREHLLTLHAAKRLLWQPLVAEGFVLRSLAGGRLLECLDAAGLPALRTLPDELGQTLSFPLRLTAVEGKLYVLR